MDTVYSVSVTAPVNIATLKYWGKRDTALNLPTNSSISITLSQDNLRTITTAATAGTFTADRLWLNGNQQDISQLPRIQTCISELRKLRQEHEQQLKAQGEKYVMPLSAFKLHIISENNFPTAAGLASSAAGLAALVRALADLFELPQSPGELSILARQGSGSACRSLFGGFVAWERGTDPSGSDSKAVSIAPKEHWPNIRAAILVVSDAKKDISSTEGMQATVATSPLFVERVNTVVPQRFEQQKQAILARDFPTFAKLTMQDSNQFHAVCLDTYPPIFYLNDVSRAAIHVVEEINKIAGETIAAYTFDAGPNAVIYYLEENESLVLGPLKHALSKKSGWETHPSVEEAVPLHFNTKWLGVLTEGVDRIILTSVGDGPKKSSIKLIDQFGGPLR